MTNRQDLDFCADHSVGNDIRSMHDELTSTINATGAATKRMIGQLPLDSVKDLLRKCMSSGRIVGNNVLNDLLDRCDG